MMNRKEFIKKTGRLIILGGMGTGAGYLIMNRRVDPTCSVSTVCLECEKFTGCTLPRAKEVHNGKE